jgi:predicted TIM-barrel fold metal-dependent hydrolase
MKFFDVHVHLPTTEWLDGCIGVYAESRRRFFNSVPRMRSVEEMFGEFADAGGGGILLGWDAERATGCPKLEDELVAQVCELSDGRFTGFGSVDPLRPDAADHLKRIADLGLRGVKLHPGLQQFDPVADEVQGFFDLVAELGLAILTHTGMSGLGARMPGGQAVRLDLADPMRFDRVAARLPELNIMLAHLGGPWIDQALTMAWHKTNVYLDMSGWRIEALPEQFRRALSGYLSSQLCFGTDYPFWEPGAMLNDCSDLGLSPEVADRFLRANAMAFLKADS